jgi:predicted DNA repair protein MutK
MASGFFAVLDDIAALMDDIAINTKLATKKTAGILGDDLAVNAEKSTGFLANREIPVLLAITKGSFINKLIIVPLAFALQFIYAPAIIWILILGGVYLAYEGAEKIIHAIGSKSHQPTIKEIEVELSSAEEKEKIQSAIKTDFILSLEIVIIALGAVIERPLIQQVISVSLVAIIATVGVYGIVALIVKMDDVGFMILKRAKNKGPLAIVGKTLVLGLPYVIKTLSVIGTIALLLVSGGIFIHHVGWFHHLAENVSAIPSIIIELIFGFAIGSIATLALMFFGFLKNIITKK